MTMPSAAIPSRVDALIVGAGPTGLTLAAELVRHGVANVAIVDRAPAPVIQTKASVLWPRSLELLEVYDGVVDALHERCLRARRATFRDRGGVINSVPLGAHLDSKYTYGLLTEQWYAEQCLASFVEKHVAIQRSTTLQSYTRTPTAVHATVTTADGTDVVVEAKYLIGADGARSSVRKLMHCGFEGVVMPGQFLSVHFRPTAPIDALADLDGLTFFLFENGASFATPMPNGTFLVAIDMDDAEGASYRSDSESDRHGLPMLRELTHSELEAVVSAHMGPVSFESVLWASHFRINERLAAAYDDGGRVFLAGDACHCHSPLYGQGMNTGIQDAVNLGWKLSFVLRGFSSDSLLRTYGEERRLVGDALVAMTTRGQSLASSRNTWFHALRKFVLQVMAATPLFASKAAAFLGETAIAYRGSVLSVEHWDKPSLVSHASKYLRQIFRHMLGARVQAGDRCPWHVLPSATCPRDTTQCLALLFEGCEDATVAPMTTAQLSALGEQIVRATNGVVGTCIVVPASNTVANARFGVGGQCVFLLRPDGYVGLRCEPVSVECIVDYLGARLGVLKL
ncbi:hypothetical protein SDRG_10561 [Saprolegnia diclina VS20]|uniref:FAD-binding domain-containing protein n=1 Tax=Saprolegnia diclina (strain VS20) TaxID=1156394 RepID=T0RNX7_SAPDV|nr:hypothetical protein SDRG_10561 [Saprolegnia diclina VS20]EQC31772.1 hypothetical protein SDRG_10561 [Saprolegnia diclina VS20]|eukprot:XP_008614779.1 hypothetical protein SDRG_10561 [Saprolegnia diclina VS20]